MLEKDAEHQLDRLSEKWSSITKRNGRKTYPAYKKKKEG